MVAYLINQYPKVSHSFVRREIRSLEKQGCVVSRYAIRGWDADVVDSGDIEEQRRTTYLLRRGVAGLVRPTAGVFVRSPRRFIKTLVQAIKLAKKSDRSVVYHLVYLMEACKFLEQVSNVPVTHIHAHFGTNSTEVAMLVRCLGGPPYSFTVHGPEEFDKPGGLHLAEKIMHAKFVVAISSYGRSQLYRWVSHKYWSKIRIVRCGLEKGFYKEVGSPFNSNHRLICVGRLCEQKGQMLLVEAVKSLLSKGIDVELVLAGDGEMRSDIEALVSGLGLDDHIKITGWLSGKQVREEIVGSRALVLPSFAEGLPVVVMEAMALKRPVLTTYIAGIPELVTDGENGWLFPAGSVDSLAAAMEECLRAPTDVLARFGAGGRARVVEMHDSDTEAAKLAEMFEADASQWA